MRIPLKKTQKKPSAIATNATVVYHVVQSGQDKVGVEAQELSHLMKLTSARIDVAIVKMG
jgi:hypothetical protein